MTTISRVKQVMQALVHPHSFPREALWHGFLARRSSPVDWFEYRASVSRIHAARRTATDGLQALQATELFAGIAASEAHVVLRDHSPYNVSLHELVVISALTRLLRPSVVFEFGTFDGRTTLHLAMNAPPNAIVHTLDILSGDFPFGSDAPYLAPVRIGQSFLDTPYRERIDMITGDSRTADLTRHHGACDLVFVDADHSYDGVINDSHIAFKMVRAGGVIVWHDYLMLDGVTRALAELAQSRPLFHVAGTTLAVMKA